LYFGFAADAAGEFPQTDFRYRPRPAAEFSAPMRSFILSYVEVVFFQHQSAFEYWIRTMWTNFTLGIVGFQARWKWHLLFSLALSVFSAQAHTASLREYLPTNEYLGVNDIIVSPTKQFFVLQQSDGNLCVYERDTSIDGMMHSGRNSRVQYCTLAKGQTVGSYFTIMQGDGNFCTYRGTGPGDNKGMVQCVSQQPRGGNNYFAQVSDNGSFEIHVGKNPSSSTTVIWSTKNPDADASEQLVAEAQIRNVISAPRADCPRYVSQNDFNHCVANNIAYPKAVEACRAVKPRKGGNCLAEHLPFSLPMPPKPSFTPETGPRYGCTKIEDANLKQQCIKINLSWDRVSKECQLGSKGARSRCMDERMLKPPALFRWDESHDHECRSAPVPQRCRDLARAMDTCPPSIANEFIQADCLIKFNAGKSQTKEVPKQSSVEVLAAFYGVEGRPAWTVGGVSVVARISGAMKDGKIYVPADMNDFFKGDPIPGAKKLVAVQVRYQGKVLNLRQTEGKALIFPGNEKTDYYLVP